MRTRKSLLLTVLLILVLALGLLLLPAIATAVQGVQAPDSQPQNRIFARAVALETGSAQPAPYEQFISSGTLYTLLEASGELDQRAAAANLALSSNKATVSSGNPIGSLPLTQGCQNVYHRFGSVNIRVNQDCSLRRQAEEVIAVNPNNPNNLIAGQNDSRIGYNHCGFDFSFNGGLTWGDMIPPFWGFVLGDGHTADACSDPTVTFDADGNAYVAGIIFDLASAANGIVVAKSNAGIGGAFFHSPDSSDPYQIYSTNVGVVVSDNDPNIAHDKEFIVADASNSSPKRNNVYATWTRFANTTFGVGGNSPINFSQSIDGGATWSPPIEISGASAEVCGLFSGSADPDACDQDQGSHPTVGADGTIYVVFGNSNTPNLGENQVLFVSCPASADCSDPGSWTAPVKVGDLIGKQPLGPDPATGCPYGRGCLPPNGYRVPEFTSMSTSVDKNGTLFVAWADFRNGGGSCDWEDGTIGSAATATPPCDNDVFYAYSTDGGATWSDTRQLTPPDSAQWQPWSAVTSDGRTLWVAYYDRSYGDCEFTGCNDITLAKVRRPASDHPYITYQRLTTTSMPNLTPDNNPVQAGFLGDYMWVTTDKWGRPYTVWADTRGLRGTVEEDIYFYRGLRP